MQAVSSITWHAGRASQEAHAEEDLSHDSEAHAALTETSSSNLGSLRNRQRNHIVHKALQDPAVHPSSPAGPPRAAEPGAQEQTKGEASHAESRCGRFLRSG